MTVLVLPYPVSANRYWRSFVPRGSSRAIVTRSPEANAFIQTVQLLAITAGVRDSLNGWLYVTIRLYPNRPKDWEKRQRLDPFGWEHSVQCLDVGNCEKVLCDALNGILWKDDKQIRRMVLERMSPDEHGGRVVVEIAAEQTA